LIVSCDSWKFSSFGYVCFNEPARLDVFAKESRDPLDDHLLLWTS
jgi:hypothetical protein